MSKIIKSLDKIVNIKYNNCIVNKINIKKKEEIMPVFKDEGYGYLTASDCLFFKLVTYLGPLCEHPDADALAQKRRTPTCIKKFCPLLKEKNSTHCNITV